jgi:lipopolysaccharide/colanic/teichoic acid biosynthesis glycosyltransferase
LALTPHDLLLSTDTPGPQRALGWADLERLDPTVDLDVEPASGWSTLGKPLFDYTAALLLLVPGLPLIALAWLAIKITSRGPGFYTQTRLGADGTHYKIIKIRTMILDSEINGAEWARQNDSRVTALGRFLRITHLDELPQLFNVLRGEMSLVGPRPERPEMIQRKGLNQLVPGYQHRLLVKPGVTGFAQVQLPADTDINSVRRKVAYDFYYIETSTLWLDFRILAATVLKSFVSFERLQKLCLLPSRDDVAAVFHSKVTPPSPSRRMSRLQPA